MNKVALITSCAKGIGRQLAIDLAIKGYDIIITYNTSEVMALDLKKYIESNYNIKALVIKCDISNEKDIINMKNEILKFYNHIDLLINNAALSLDNYICDKTKEEFMKVLEVNVVGTFLVTKYLCEYMNNGVIVNISSTDSIDTYSTLNIDYAASKAGVNMLTKVFALSYPNIKVIGAMPNWTDTESIREMNQDYLKSELKRIGQSKLESVKEVSNNIINLIEDNEIYSGQIKEV